jgi:pyridoxine 4-dehydrogenase
VHYSLLDYNSKALQEMEATCRELGVKIVAFSPIGQGLLTGGLTTEKWQHNKPAKMLRLQWDDIQPLRAKVEEKAQKYGKTMGQVALNWCIQHNVIPLVGCRSVEQARDSVGCLGWSLEEKDVRDLDQVALGKSTLESK